MGTAPGLTETVLYDTLMNYLVSMARTVEGAMNRALDSLVGLQSPATASLPGEVFLLEPRINEMEIVIDEHAIRLLRRGSFSDDEMRLIVAALKITNDLERIGVVVEAGDRGVGQQEIEDRHEGDRQEHGPGHVAPRVVRLLGQRRRVLPADEQVDGQREGGGQAVEVVGDVAGLERHGAEVAAVLDQHGDGHDQ